MQAYFFRFTSLHSAALCWVMETMGEPRRLFFWWTFFIVTEELWTIGFWKVPHYPQSLIYFTCQFQKLSEHWGLLGLCPLPADPCVLGVSQNVNENGSICALWYHRITSQVEPTGMLKDCLGKRTLTFSSVWRAGLEWMEVRGKKFSISNQGFAFVLPLDEWFGWLFSGCSHIRFNVTCSLCSWALPVGLVELIVFWWQFRRWLTYLANV